MPKRDAKTVVRDLQADELPPELAAAFEDALTALSGVADRHEKTARVVVSASSGGPDRLHMEIWIGPKLPEKKKSFLEK